MGFGGARGRMKEEKDGEGVPSCQPETGMVKNRIPAGLRHWRKILGLFPRMLSSIFLPKGSPAHPTIPSKEVWKDTTTLVLPGGD